VKNLFKSFGVTLGVGILTGFGTRAGIMLVDALFPNGLGNAFSKLKADMKAKKIVFNSKKACKH
jgi:hypothetical protein